MTGDDRIFETRKACLAYAEQVGNVSKVCRVFGISRTTFYEWKRRADRYGIDGLRPRARRRPAQPNQTPVWQVEIVLAEAISRPTLGARRLVEYCQDRGVQLSASGIEKILRRHSLGRRAQRVAMLAQLTAVTDGVASREAVEGEFGFCHFAAFPGDLVALDAFYVGSSKAWEGVAVHRGGHRHPRRGGSTWSLTTTPPKPPPRSSIWLSSGSPRWRSSWLAS